MKNNIKHGLLFLGASIICAILFLYLWDTQILDDMISDKGPLTLEGSSNAIRMGFCHCVIQWILFIATFVLAITAICTFGNEREDYSNVNIKKNEKSYSFGLPICKNTSMIDVSLRLVIL